MVDKLSPKGELLLKRQLKGLLDDLEEASLHFACLLHSLEKIKKASRIYGIDSGEKHLKLVFDKDSVFLYSVLEKLPQVRQIAKEEGF